MPQPLRCQAPCLAPRRPATTPRSCANSTASAAWCWAVSSRRARTSAATQAASPTAAAADRSKLLIDAADIVAPGDTFTAQEPTMNPAGADGVATVFSNGGDTREIGDTILVLPDAAGAATALQGAKAALGSSVVGGTPASASIGTDSVIVAGKSPDGAKEVTVLLFTQGPAFTTLEFDSAAGDPVPQEFVLDVAGKQAKKIADGLGG